MDINQLAGVLRATLQPDQREQAEQQLNKVHKIIDFSPSLLQVVMSDQYDMPVRQAGVIYLKNMVSQFWEEREAANVTDPVPFSLHERDKQTIRNHIVDAVIVAPDPIRVQLAVCISQIVKHDYPGKWPEIAHKVANYIQSDEYNTWLGAFICLYQLVKNFEYKKPEERGSLNDAMQVLLPLIHQRCAQLLSDQSELSVLIQKQILKVFFALIQEWIHGVYLRIVRYCKQLCGVWLQQCHLYYSQEDPFVHILIQSRGHISLYFLPLDLITREMFTQWMELVRQIVERPIPEACMQVDEDDRPELVWWKCKKWALHILARCFERYGSPGNVTKEYKDFSEWYLKSFSAGILAVLLKLLDQYRQKIYVAPRVLQQTLNYLNQGVSHALSWKIIKPYMVGITQEVLFPLMCHNDEDEDLWHSDPVEYIRVKYDVFEEFFSPVTAAQALLHSAVSKRKQVLDKTMEFITRVLTSTPLDPRQKAGALHMVGAVGDILLQKQMYKSQVENMLVSHVFTEFSSEHGYLRARACWVLHCFCEVNFTNEANLVKALERTHSALTTDKELPVRVEAAIALQMLLVEQKRAKDILKPHVSSTIVELLKIIHETENDDLTSVLQKLVCTYVDEIAPLAVEITNHLAQTFAKVLDSDTDGSDEKAIAAMGILNTLETIVTVLEDKKEVLQQVEGIVLNVVGLILQKNLIEFYEELLSLVYSLTCSCISERMWSVFPMLFDLFKNDNIDYFTDFYDQILSLVSGLTCVHISERMWEVLPMINEMFETDGFDYFTDMMPALHNYVTVDEATFSSDPKYLEMIFRMCKSVLSADAGEDAECHAAKLLEVILLQYKGQVDSVLTSFVEVALERLTREVRTSELRTMCLQVVVAALYYNPLMLLDILLKMHLPNSNESIIAQFLKQWLHDTDCFVGLHDRKICVLGLVTLMDTPSTRPQAINEIAQQIIPALLMLFSGLQRAYASRAEAEGESDDEDEDENEEEGELDDDDDEIDEDGQQYIEKLEKSANEDDDSEDEYDDEAEETALESYQTPLDAETCPVDEYQVFKGTLISIEQRDPAWYQALCSHLDDSQKKELAEVFKLADQRKAAADSKKIQEAGGYVFQNTTVPQSFNFCSP